MTDTAAIEPRPTLKLPEGKRKTARKSQPVKFPCRISVCFAPDQIQTLAQAKEIYRANEAFMLRLAWDNFFERII